VTHLLLSLLISNQFAGIADTCTNELRIYQQELQTSLSVPNYKDQAAISSAVHQNQFIEKNRKLLSDCEILTTLARLYPESKLGERDSVKKK
jgi:hypothetical protein